MLTPLLLAISVYLLLRGHDEPGGGFIGGLVAVSGLIIHALAHSFESLRRLIRVEPHTLMGAGWLLAAGSALPSLLLKGSFMEAYWFELGPLKFGTPVVFDIGVYLIVIGMLTVVLEVMWDR